ncbi:MAG TPA: hypothetical protein VF743_02335 [Acidimicrobiales bacterium]
MSDDETKGPIEQAVEALVYAPIGLFFEAPTLLPKLIEQGKIHARNARLFGQFAVEHGQGELRRRLGDLEEQAGELLRTLGVTHDADAVVGPPGARGAPGTGAAATNGAAARDLDAIPVTPDGSGDSAIVAAAAFVAAGTGPSVDELAIPDYDSLSASQVVTRLPGLTLDELEAVRAYEVAHRGRKTILNKVAQLQA